MKKKIFKILILIIIILAIVITIFTIRKKTYNKIEENWILKISPNKKGKNVLKYRGIEALLKEYIFCPTSFCAKL